MIKSYLKQVCNLEEEIHERSLKLDKSNDEYKNAQKRIKEKKERLKNEIEAKKAKLNDVSMKRKRTSSYVPKGILYIIFIFIAIIVGTVLLAWGIRFLVLNVFKATNAVSATNAYMVINILPILAAYRIQCMIDEFNWKNTAIFIGIYVLITYLTSTYFKILEQSGHSISYCMALFEIILIIIEVIVGIIVCLVVKNKQDKEYLDNRNQLKELDKEINKQKVDIELSVKKMSEYIINSQKALDVMTHNIMVQKQNLDKIKVNLSKLYAKNVLHPKYQYWVAASTIYEYFDTGICAELQGYRGAYKFYEEQLIGKQIVSSLSELAYSVKLKANRIQDSQSYIKSQLEECNRKLDDYKFNTYGY